MLTVKLQLLQPRRAKREALLEYMRDFTLAVSWYLERLQGLGTTSRSQLHKALYQEARGVFPIHSGNLQVAMDKAIEAQRSFLARKGKKRPPSFHALVGIFRQDTFRVLDNAIELRFAGRRVICIPFKVGEHHRHLLARKAGRAEIRCVSGKWYAYVSFENPKEGPRRPETVVGVDLGLSKLAVASTPAGRSQLVFRGEKAARMRAYYRRRRAELQARKAQGSKNAYRVLKRLSGKERRWMTNENHVISKRLVSFATIQGAGLAMELLDGIRERLKATRRVRHMLHSWAFRQLATFVEYKAGYAGVAFSKVDPHKTSQTCPGCGHAERGNRKTQANFTCLACGYRANADHVAARNIALRGLQALGLGLDPGSTGGCDTAQRSSDQGGLDPQPGNLPVHGSPRL